MKLVVGLGNPGKKYDKTRHNIGFRVVDEVAHRRSAVFEKDEKLSLLKARFRLGGEVVLLVKPTSFMNLSGTVVRPLLEKNRLTAEDLLVVVDDLDLDLGRLRIRCKGGSAGHNGLQSIIDEIGTNNFVRVRVGIGRSCNKGEVVDYVLSGFSDDEIPVVDEVVGKAADAVRMLLDEGAARAMNTFNERGGQDV